MHHPEFILHTEYLKAGYFYNTENGSIYWAIQELYKAGVDNIDAYNLSNQLQSNPAVSKTMKKYNMPEVQQFMELYNEAARDTIEEYKLCADNVVAYSFKRDLIKTLNSVEKKCYKKDSDLEKLSNVIYDELDGLTSKYITTTEVKTLGESIDDIWQDIVDRRTEDGIYGLPSKYPLFNKYFTYEPGELVVVQAKYKRGKSVLLMNEVCHKLKMGVPVLVVDTEMQTRLYTERLLSHLTGIDIHKIKNGQYSDEEAQTIKSAINWIKEQRFCHIYDPQITNERLYTICKMLKYKMGLQFVVFDYIKSNETSTSDNYNILGAKCDFLKNRIAGELNLSVLTAAQLNRQGQVADSDKINRYLSVGIKWDTKTLEQVTRDGENCGDACAKIYVNRLGEQMQEDDEMDYIDFRFSGNTMTIEEAEQHDRNNAFS